MGVPTHSSTWRRVQSCKRYIFKPSPCSERNGHQFLLYNWTDGGWSGLCNKLRAVNYIVIKEIKLSGKAHPKPVTLGNWPYTPNLLWMTKLMRGMWVVIKYFYEFSLKKFHSFQKQVNISINPQPLLFQHSLFACEVGSGIGPRSLSELKFICCKSGVLAGTQCRPVWVKVWWEFSF